jgi:hypothetical protein
LNNCAVRSKPHDFVLEELTGGRRRAGLTGAPHASVGGCKPGTPFVAWQKSMPPAHSP